MKFDGESSEEYLLQQILSFSSVNFTENLLSLLRVFGFLHFCSDSIFFGLDTRPWFDELPQDYWLRGYSPYATESQTDKI